MKLSLTPLSHTLKTVHLLKSFGSTFTVYSLSDHLSPVPLQLPGPSYYYLTYQLYERAS